MLGLLCLIQLSAASEIHVRPDGDPSTIHAAIEKARETGAKSIVVHAGVYRLDRSLQLTSADNGLVIQSAPGEDVIVSGGAQITGWSVNSRGWWTAPVSGVFTQLWVDGQRRYRPRYPANGFSRIGPRVPASEAVASRGFDRMRYLDGGFDPAWKNRGDIEIVTFHNWTISRMRIASIDADRRLLAFTGPTRCTSDYCSFVPGNRFLAENVAEMLGEPGSWYLDRPAGLLTYVPHSGETPSSVIVPRLEQLLVIDGASNITVAGIAFEHTNYTWPQAGYSSFQSEVNLDGAITLRNASNITLSRIRVAHTATHGIVLNGASRGNRIEDSVLFDLGAGGIRVGDTTRPNPPAGDNIIRNNLILSGGRHHPAGCGILITHAANNLIENNTIRDFYYTGVSVGWSWGYNPSPAVGNVVRRNVIGQIGQGVLSDMGGVYTLGVSPGTQVTSNLIYDVNAFDYGGWGLYPDEGSTGILFKDNIVYRTKTGGFHQHYGRDNHILNNMFLEARVQQMQKTRIEPHNQFLFERNIVAGSEGLMLGGGGVSGADMQFRNNLYWLAGEPLKFGGQSWEQWRARGMDQGTLVADPLLTGITLAPESPAFKIGFQPIDLDDAGSRLPEPLLPPSPPAFPYSQKPTEIAVREDFEDLQPGDQALYMQLRERNPAIPGTVSGISVSAEEAAQGRHSLKLTDAEGRTDSYPHFFYQPGFKKTPLRGSFWLRMEPGAAFWHEWRNGTTPYAVGPEVRVSATGALTLRNLGTVMQLPQRAWIRFEIEATPGSGRWGLTVTVRGGESRTFRDLACSPEMESLNWWGFVSTSAQPSALFLDDLELASAP